jgi:hypothetical protein
MLSTAGEVGVCCPMGIPARCKGSLRVAQQPMFCMGRLAPCPTDGDGLPSGLMGQECCLMSWIDFRNPRLGLAQGTSRNTLTRLAPCRVCPDFSYPEAAVALWRRSLWMGDGRPGLALICLSVSHQPLLAPPLGSALEFLLAPLTPTLLTQPPQHPFSSFTLPSPLLHLP